MHTINSRVEILLKTENLEDYIWKYNELCISESKSMTFDKPKIMLNFYYGFKPQFLPYVNLQKFHNLQELYEEAQ